MRKKFGWVIDIFSYVWEGDEDPYEEVHPPTRSVWREIAEDVLLSFTQRGYFLEHYPKG